MSLTHTEPAVRYDVAGPTLYVRDLTVSHPAVTGEARRWSSGRRGDAVAETAMEGIDLRAFAEQALIIGAQAITCAGGTQDAANLETLVQQLGERATRSAAEAAKGTRAAVETAGLTVAKAAAEAQDVIGKAGALARTTFTDEVTTARKCLEAEMTRLVGGESPELVGHLRALLDSFGKDVEARSSKQIAELIAGATKMFDPSDPTSPMARQQAELGRQNEALAALMISGHEEVAKDVRELTTVVREQQAAAKARGALVAVTPIKGADYETSANAVLEQISAALGGEYLATGTTVGALPKCFKGDGVLTLDGGAARIVFEMHDGSGRRDWNGYLAEAERNRDAVVSLGLVPDVAHNQGLAVRALGPRRMVMAYQPGADDDLLRAAVQLMRVVALASTRQSPNDDLAVVRERLDEAITALSNLGAIRKNANGIRKSADAIERDADALDVALNRLLGQARAALTGAQQTAETTTGDVVPAGA